MEHVLPSQGPLWKSNLTFGQTSKKSILGLNSEELPRQEGNATGSSHLIQRTRSQLADPHSGPSGKPFWCIWKHLCTQWVSMSLKLTGVLPPRPCSKYYQTKPLGPIQKYSWDWCSTPSTKRPTPKVQRGLNLRNVTDKNIFWFSNTPKLYRYMELTIHQYQG